MPFGEEHAAGQTCPGGQSANCQRREFTGKERDAETGQDYFGARYYGARTGRFTATDPLLQARMAAADPQRWNRYAYALNNPIRYLDPDGRSTWTTEDGTVVAVHNDGDLAVYRGSDQVGETAYWDEFREHDHATGAVKASVIPGARIDFGSSWDPAIASDNAYAISSFDLPGVAMESRNGRYFDIKSDPQLSPYGPGTGRKLNGKYASAESAGNYLAGLNMATVTWPGGFGIDGETGMRLAGMLEKGKFSKWNAWRVLATGKAFGPPPWYGEIEYAGRRIREGYNAGSDRMDAR